MDDPAAVDPNPSNVRPGPDDLPLDADLIKVLASDSRRDILRLLKQRRMTLTELAAALDLKKATVLEHLKRLTDAGLIRRIDDERLWVYYELSPGGKRVVNPGRTRFYLLMGVATAALVLGAVAIVAVHDALAPTPEAASPPLAVRVQQSEAAGSGVGVNVTLANGGGADTRAYLLDANEAQQLRADKRVVAGIPLTLEGTSGDVARYATQSPVPGGTYFVYVVDAQGRDNIEELQTVHVPSLVVQAPPVVWRGLDDGASFRVERDSNATDGTLMLVSSDGHELPTLPVENGSATLDAPTLDRLVPADYVVQFLPSGSQYWVSTDTHVLVRDALAAVAPLRVAEGQRADLTIALAPPGVAGAPDAALAIDGARAQNATRLSPMTMGLALAAPAAAGTLDVGVGRLAHVPVQVEGDVAISFVATNDSRLTVTLARAGNGTPLAGALLQLDGANLGTTDANGTIVLAAPLPSGEHALRVIADGAPVLVEERGIVTNGDRVAELVSAVDVRNVRARDAADGALTIDALVTNHGPARAEFTLSALVDGSLVASQALDVPARADANATFTVRTGPLPPGDHAVRVVVEPLARAPIAFHDAAARDQGAAVASAASPDATWAQNSGNANGTTTTIAYVADASGANASTAFTVWAVTPTPTPATSATVSASPAGHAARTPGPGVAALIAAGLAVAIALRRRR